MSCGSIGCERLRTRDFSVGAEEQSERGTFSLLPAGKGEEVAGSWQNCIGDASAPRSCQWCDLEWRLSRLRKVFVREYPIPSASAAPSTISIGRRNTAGKDQRGAARVVDAEKSPAKARTIRIVSAVARGAAFEELLAVPMGEWACGANTGIARERFG